MPTATSHKNGLPCWADLASTDPAAARAFYAAVLGWVFDEPNPMFGHYSNARKDGAAVAGVAGVMEGAPPMSLWTIYLAADDIDAATARVVAAGGAVALPPMEVGPFGHMAIVSDRHGAHFGLWQAKSHTGFGLVDEPGAPCWYEVNTRGGADTAAFYAEAFGLVASPMPNQEYWTLGADGQMSYGVLQMNEQWGDMPPSWMVYFAVEDCDAAVERVRAAGGAVMVPPFDIPYGRISVVSDPTGGVFTLMKLAAAPPEA